MVQRGPCPFYIVCTKRVHSRNFRIDTSCLRPSYIQSQLQTSSRRHIENTCHYNKQRTTILHHAFCRLPYRVVQSNKEDAKCITMSVRGLLSRRYIYFQTFLSESSSWQLGTDHEVAIQTFSVLLDQFVFLSCGHPLLQIFIVRFLLNRYK